MKRIRKILQQLLKEHYPEQASYLGAEIEHEFALIEKDIAFARVSKNPMDRRMSVAAYLLAAIKVLDAHNFDYASIRRLIITLAEDYSRPKNGLVRKLKTWVPKLLSSAPGRYMLHRLDRQAQKSTQPEGFRIRVLTSPEETLGFGYGVDILECGICKLFSKHQYQKYTPILCEVDYITSSLAGLELIRRGTIANGAAICDFRYRHQNPKAT